MRAVDTNILLYVHHPRDTIKQKVAAELLASLTDGTLLWQVACEYIAASRKLAPLGFDQKQAWQNVHRLKAFGSRFCPHGRPWFAPNNYWGNTTSHSGIL